MCYTWSISTTASRTLAQFELCDLHFVFTEFFCIQNLVNGIENTQCEARRVRFHSVCVSGWATVTGDECDTANCAGLLAVLSKHLTFKAYATQGCSCKLVGWVSMYNYRRINSSFVSWLTVPLPVWDIRRTVSRMCNKYLLFTDNGIACEKWIPVIRTSTIFPDLQFGTLFFLCVTFVHLVWTIITLKVD